MHEIEANIAAILEKTSFNLSQNTELPTVEEFESMKMDQAIKVPFSLLCFS